MSDLEYSAMSQEQLLLTVQDKDAEIERLQSRLRDRQNALDHAIDYGHRKDAEIERLTKGWEGLEYETSAQIASLAAAVNTMHKEAIEQEAEIERLTEIKDLAIKDSMAEADENEQLQAEIERMQTEASCNYSCNYCGKYHGKEVCESLLAKIERLRAVVDAAAWYINSLENGKNAEAMNLRLQALRKALAALEDSDD